MNEHGVIDVRQELLGACKVALAHCRWMEANGHEVPSLPSGEQLQSVLRTAIDKATGPNRREPRTQKMETGGLSHLLITPSR